VPPHRDGLPVGTVGGAGIEAGERAGLHHLSPPAHRPPKFREPDLRLIDRRCAVSRKVGKASRNSCNLNLTCCEVTLIVKRPPILCGGFEFRAFDNLQGVLAMNAHAKVGSPRTTLEVSQDPKQFLAQHGVEIDDALNDTIRSRLSAKREGAEQALIIHLD
jgi:hypothetical protein